MNTKKIITLFLIFVMMFTTLSFADNNSQNTEQQPSDSDLKIYSDAVIIIDNKTGRTLYEKNSNEKMYPASTTKILSAIIAIEKGDLKKELTVSNAAIAEMKSGYTSAYLVEGEKITVENLLKVLLVHSANEASNVLAEYISGSIEEFVKLMNSKVKELGCTNTHFVTTNGLHDDNHYTTAKDLATIARYCMKNQTFRKIVAAPSCTVPQTNKSAQRVYKNTNDMVVPTSPYYYNGCIGIKTGYTSQAKNCLVSAVNRNGMQFIAVVLGASVTEDRKSARYVDSKTLYDYAFSNYSYKTIAKKSTVLNTIDVKNATSETNTLDLMIEKDVTALANKTDKIQKPEIKLKDNISAPIVANEVIGTATYKVGSETYTENLIASHEVVKKDDDNTFMLLVMSLAFVILIIITFIIIKFIRKHKGKHFKDNKEEA